MTDYGVNDGEDDKIRSLLMGRRIVDVAEGQYKQYGYPAAAGVLTLDDGTVLNVVPNIGGCSCGAGDYYIGSLSRVDNIITDVKVLVENTSDDKYEPDQRYVIAVWAADERINAVEIDGNDGNGYYGTGFQIYVTPASDPVSGASLDSSDKKE